MGNAQTITGLWAVNDLVERLRITRLRFVSPLSTSANLSQTVG